MIQINDKETCCGCTACYSVCPKHCITMQEDAEGFLYPVINTSFCIDCGLCEKVCPVLSQEAIRKPINVYAAKHPSEQIRLHSSSGGFFSYLAERVIDEGGVVFGATFDKTYKVIHSFAETKEELAAFRGSKYVQSRIGDSYQQARDFLEAGRKVLFSGTPCQIIGLKRFLRKNYDNLLAVDFVCHGVPSPLVWREYLAETITRQGNGKNSVFSPSKPVLADSIRGVSRIEFRNKQSGWKKYSFALHLSESVGLGVNTVLLSEFTKNPFMCAFLSDWSLRPSCYACVAKSGKSRSDLTLGDFWGIGELLSEFDDDNGVSLVMPYTEKGRLLCKEFEGEKREMTYEQAIFRNNSMEHSAQRPLYRMYFFHCFQKEGFYKAFTKTGSRNIFWRLRRLLYRKYGI